MTHSYRLIVLTAVLFILSQNIFSQERIDTLFAEPGGEKEQYKLLTLSSEKRLYKPIESFADLKVNRNRKLDLLFHSRTLDSGRLDSSRLKSDTIQDLTPQQKTYKGYESRTHLLTSLVQMALIEYIPFAMAKYLRNWEDTEEENWTKITFNTWKKNIREGFEYDGDNFLTNYFSHPYHGNLYFNAGRSNGYDFWQSSIYTFIGSGIWEMFAETFRPSFNDLVNTTVNGINFGETLFRLSAMVTDNRETGFDRVWREVVGGIINPVRGVNRLISGDSFKRFDNPYYGKQPKFLVKFTAGVRRLDESQNNIGEIFSKGSEQGIYGIDIRYGDIFSTIAPFSYFTFGAELNTGAPQLGNIYSSGHIYGFTVSNTKILKQKLNISLDYSYTNNPGFQYGQTSIIPNFLTKVDIGKLDLFAQIGINGILLGGTNTDYFVAEDGRDYDMGPGIGAIGDIELMYKNWSIVKLTFTNGWIFSMTEPQESTHNLNYILLRLTLPLQEYFAVGLDASIFWRKSYYEGSPDVKRQVPIVKLYFSTFL